MSGFECRIEWLEAPDVSTPELSKTWARYEIWVNQKCVTQVEADGGTFRRSVYGSLYPLAEWIVANWWLLVASVRPSAVSSRYWSWPNVRTQDWLRHHNLRSAGDGMAWPNVTIVPEGSMTCIRWFADGERTLAHVRFVSADTALVDSTDVVAGLDRIVTSVLERLAEEGLQKTGLSAAWSELGHLDDEERKFCGVAARLGVDPLSVTDELADDIVTASSLLPDEISDDFFDSADPHSVVQAARWTNRAAGAAAKASGKAGADLRDLYRATSPMRRAPDSDRDWETGYALARSVRQALQIDDESSMDISPWLGIGNIREDSGGIQGLAVVDDDRCGLVLGGPRLSKQSRVFWQARALGRTLVRPDQRTFLLSPAGSYEERVARAFAAELLSPAAGVRKALDTLGREDDEAFETVAVRFGVSPILVRHQYDNQLARTAP